MNNLFEMFEIRRMNVRITRFAHYSALLAMWLPAGTSRADIPEPDTVFYGRIINRTSQQEDLVTQGTLSWVVSRPDGKQITLSTTLTPLNDGLYSYSLRVPHSALVLGASVSSNAIPLTGQSANCSHVQISVDGVMASILPPGSSTFSVSQLARSSTYRLDLELFNPLTDAAGDGIADWWKLKYGVMDPSADPDHDGWSNLQEYLHGGNPNRDDRVPSILTGDMFVYAGGSTGMRLQALDSDSGATNLTYTLLTPPGTGKLYLRNVNSDTALSAGATFTQADLNQGRLQFTHTSTDSLVTADSLLVSLRDENATHPPVTNHIALNIYRPSYPDATLAQARAVPVAPAGFTDLPGLSFYEQQMVLNYYLSRDHGYVVWDASAATAPQELRVPSSGLSPDQYAEFVTAYGQDKPHILVAGAGNDRLVGGMENDILIAGRGSDTLRGNGGSDLFVVSGPHPGTTTIEDFNVAERDALDISRALTGGSTALSRYVQLSNSGGSSYLGINFKGEGTGFTDLVISLPGTKLAQADLSGLVDNGTLITGNKVFSSGVSIAATVPAASQNGPVAGQFAVTRSGPVDAEMTVKLQITGSAVNGSDYQYLDSQITFAPGQRTVTLTVNPYTTSAAFGQVVQVSLMADAAYELGNASRAQVTIEPLMPQISIQALSPIASRFDQAAGLFLITRGGVLNNSVLVRLSLGGTASAGHYNSIASFINLIPQQTTALISVTPKISASIPDAAESVQITILPDASYKVMNPASDRVLLVDRLMTLGVWQQQNFPSSTDMPAVFASQDSGQTGIRNLFRYAFGLNPLAPRNSTRVPTAQILSDHAVLSYKRPPAITDLNYLVEMSDDLVHWRSATNEFEPYFPAARSNDFETVFLRNKSSVTQAPKSFLRVRIELQP